MASTPLTDPAQLVTALNAAGITTVEQFAAFVGSAVKPLERAAIQQQIDDENKAFQQAMAAHNAALQALQSQLNAV